MITYFFESNLNYKQFYKSSIASGLFHYDITKYIKFLDNPYTRNRRTEERRTEQRDEREKNSRERETIGDNNRDNIVTRYRSVNESEKSILSNARIRRRVSTQVNRIGRQ